MASAAAIPACADCASWSAMCIAARADVTGVEVRDAAIRIARMTRRRRSETSLPQASRAWRSYMNAYIVHIMAELEEDRQQVLEL